MHTHDLTPWRHEHVFDTGNAAGERGTRWVMALTAAMMLVEIGAGWFYNSIALLADGFHMSSHAVAIGLSAFAYWAARRFARDPRYAFGTWKLEVLASFASAVFLLVIAGLMVVGSVERLFVPEPVRYQEALVVAAVGLLVNLVSAFILGAAHHQGQAHGHHHHPGSGHSHGHGAHAQHQDLNLKSAYLHVVADAATSVLALVALAGGWLLGWAWLDPAMGLVGAALVALWAKGLIAETAKVLLDREMDDPVVDEIRGLVAERGAAGETLIADLHVWRVGRAAYACALSVVTHDPELSADEVRRWLSVHEEIAHATVEIHRCPAD